MTDPCLIGEHLASILDGEKTVFVKCEPAPLDFTKPSDSFLSVVSKKASLKVPLKEQVDNYINLLALSVFDGERTVVAWDIKPILAYFKYQGHPDAFAELRLNRLTDLKLCESFLGKDLPAPQTWVEAVKRLKACLDTPALKVHKAVHVPLASRVVPAMEAWGVVDDWRKKTVFPSYTIEGQVHGRMSCHVSFDRCVNPHSLDDDVKSVLKPKAPHSLFVQMDYRAMEVVVLQWLSKDPKLGEILANPKHDLYAEVFKIVADTEECGPEERNLAKGFFLPVFYGMQSYALSQKLGINQDLAQQIIDLIGQKFPTAWGWVQEQHDKAKATKQAVDYFGRVREVEEPYLARHFCIAAPAALVCLERLVRLYDTLPAEAKVVFSIHDGYVLATNRPCLNKVVAIAKEALEAESALCPGLKLRTSCEVGKSLGKMIRAY